MIFEADGCDNAQSAIEAAEYIEQFVGLKYAQSALRETT